MQQLTRCPSASPRTLAPYRALAFACLGVSALAASWSCSRTEAKAATDSPYAPVLGLPYVLYHTYGQYADLEAEDDLPAYFHDGIDVGACPDGRGKVLALEAGYVVWNSFQKDEYAAYEDYDSHSLIISRGEDRRRGMKYIHLADTPLRLGDKVECGDYLGSVFNFLPSGFEHWHLKLVRRSPAEGSTNTDESWGFAEDLDDGNPLLELGEVFQDDDPPSIQKSKPPGGSPAVFHFYDSDGNQLAPDQLCGAVQIVAELHDECGTDKELDCDRPVKPKVVASHIVAPLGFELRIRSQDPSVPEKVFSLDLSLGVGTLLKDEDILQVYHSSSAATCSERHLCFVLSQDAADQFRWKPLQGDYSLELKVRDAARHTTTLPLFPVKVIGTTCP